MSLRLAMLSYLGLLLLLALTVGSTFVPLGAGNTLLNIGIAGAKAAIIGLVFMHLRRSSMLVSLTVLALFLFLSLMFGMTLVDVLNR